MTVVYLHAVGLDGRLWDGVARPGDRALDLPGCGVGPRRAGPPTLNALAEQVGEMLGDVLDGPADVVGLSVGSMLAQHIAVRRPELVRSLVLACGGMRMDPVAARERAADVRTSGMAGTVEETLRRWFTAEALAQPGHAGVAYARARLLADAADAVASYWEAMAGHDLTGLLGAVGVPTTCIGATRDASVPLCAMRAVAEAVPGARLVEVEGPHMVVLENPVGFAAALESHLARVDALAGA